jgi:hypothetical protein
MKDEPLGQIDILKSTSNFEDIAAALNIDVHELREQHYGFHSVEENHVKCSGGKHFLMTLEQAGIFAYTDEYWLREGRKEMNERIYDYTKWSLPVLSLIISLFALYISLSSKQQPLKKAPIQQKQVDSIRQK